MSAKGEAMIQQADKLLYESWKERIWSRPSMATAGEPRATQRRRRRL